MTKSLTNSFNPKIYVTDINNNKPLTDEEFNNLLKQKNTNENYPIKSIYFNPETYVIL